MRVDWLYAWGIISAHKARQGDRKVTGDDDPNTAIRLELGGQVTLQRLVDAAKAWTGLLREVGRDVVGATERDAVRYVITEAKGGSLTLGVSPRPGNENVSAEAMLRIAPAVTSGIRLLEQSAERPENFTDVALQRLRELALLADPETPEVRVGNSVPLSRRLVQHVEKVLTPEFTSIGTVEGRLEGLIIHGKSRFIMVDHLTKRQISCYFTKRVEWKLALKLFGTRVAATGRIRSRVSGEKMSIQVTHLQPLLQPEEELPSANDVLGIIRT